LHRHYNCTFNSAIKLNQRLANAVKQQVEAIEFLAEEDTQSKWLAVIIKLENVRVSSLSGEVRGYSLGESLCHLTAFIFR